MCVGGLITHPCECESEHGCHPESGGEHDSDCHHEDTCADDPCGNLVTLLTRPTVSVGPSLETLLPCFLAESFSPDGSSLAMQWDGLNTTRLEGIPPPLDEILLLI
jgi:hypothetical protein